MQAEAGPVPAVTTRCPTHLISTRSPRPAGSGAAHGWEDAGDGMAAITSVVRAQQLFLGRIDAVLRPLELTFARYEVLMLLLFSRRGSLPLNKIGARLQVHPTSVTNAVDRLEEQDLIKRVPHSSDRRTTLAENLAGGPRLALRATRALNEEVFSQPGMSREDLNQLIDVLQRFRQRRGTFPSRSRPAKSRPGVSAPKSRPPTPESVDQGRHVGRRCRAGGGRGRRRTNHLVVKVNIAGTAKGASRLTIRHSPGISVWISGPRADRSCLAEERRILRSFSSARPSTKKVLNWLSNSSSSNLGCWVTAQQPDAELPALSRHPREHIRLAVLVRRPAPAGPPPARPQPTGAACGARDRSRKAPCHSSSTRRVR